MSENKRSSNQTYSENLSSPGPYIGRVVNNIDPMRQGSLEVELLRRVGNQPSASQQLFTVRYLSPFYGVTGVEHNGNEDYDFNHTQKSYGFWAVPPDTGTLIMVIFVDSDPGQGYWFGCVQDAYMNHMIPGIAASESYNQTVRKNDETGWNETSNVSTEYGSEIPQYAGGGKIPLPVGEINRVALRKETPQSVVDANIKPVHPITENLSAQGLLIDSVRGTHTSSSRRDTPSNVYGMSTPGPIDKRTNAQKGKIGRKDAPVQSFVSRLGGHTIVMDDGNDRKLRRGKPWEEPYEYVDVEQGSTEGLANFPKDESFRIRTRTGHQILMHNSEDLVYITNSRGTAWIELTSNGKIDIYAQDSISIRTEQDFNFVASRDFNVHAGRAVNLFSTNTTSMSSGNDFSVQSGTSTVVASQGSVNIEGTGNLTFTGQYDNFEITTKKFAITASEIDLRSGGPVVITGQGNVELKSMAGSFNAASEGTMNFLTANNVNVQGNATINLKAGQNVKIGATGGYVSLKSGVETYLQSGAGMSLKAGGPIAADGGPMILLNSGASSGAADPDPATEARTAQGAQLAYMGDGKTEGLGGTQGGELTLYPLPGVGQVIVKRAPTAEPYLHHENFNPAGFTPDLTDRENPQMPYAYGDPQFEIRTPEDADSIPAEYGGNSGYDGENNTGAAGGGLGNIPRHNGTTPDFSQSHNDQIDEKELAKMPKAWASDKAFLGKVQELCGELNCDFIDMLTLMMFETAKTMSPSIRNPYGYVGLIQFGAAAAKTIGTTTSQLRQMSRVQQMEYVKKYFQYWKGKMGLGGRLTLAQIYLLVALPAYSKYPPNGIIAARGGPRSKMWRANPGWRTSANGPITRESIGNAPRPFRKYVLAGLNSSGYSTSNGPGGPGVTPGAPSGGHGLGPR